MNLTHYGDVTLLITHYNRSASLERLLEAFGKLGCSFNEIVVSDDGSRQPHLTKIEKLQGIYNFRLITAPQNRGLGNNINKGQDAVTSAYTLYIQEDFVPKKAFPAVFADALELMNADKGIDLARFYAYFKYPYTRPYKKGFSEMVFKRAPWFGNHLKFYFYSDHPHLRRSGFLEKFGRYPEGIKGDDTEFKMALSVIRNKARGIFYDDFTGVFDQMNSPDEPSTMARSDWRQGKSLPVLMLRRIYLQYRYIKNNFQLYFSK